MGRFQVQDFYIAVIVAIHYYSTKKECSCQYKNRLLVKSLIAIMIRSSTVEVTQVLTITSELFIWL